MPCAGGTVRGSQRGGTVLRDSNRRRLLALLQDHGALTRADLVRRSGISRATVSGVVAALLDEGFIREVAPPSGGRDGRVGRPSSLLTLDPASGAAVGIDVDHDCLRVVVAEAGLEPSQILGVGMGLSGPLDRVTGRPNPSSISPSWVGVDAAREMQRHVGHVVHIDNDANLGALAESMWGAGRGASEAAYVKVDTGGGAALILVGQIYPSSVWT